ncbi:hypothetical protein AAFF_G00287870 [Aldrovandia affinis]|uniref:Chromo domain-containing protein n=1 Tax=Aldrovandia affinis TaxID=143900 RepID=A0AAD7WRV0_9TELE|nr:hypothetical protein AAFF_G00287870 [Aldrovandia affinis]
MEETATEGERSEPEESEQEEKEDVYEVERIIDTRTVEGEVLYRVRWKNYNSDQDTWEPEGHLEDCTEVLLTYKRKLAENKRDTAVVEGEQAKVTAREPPPQKLPMKSDLFDADSESEDERPDDASPPKKKKKKKKKSSKEGARDPSPDPHWRERRKDKKRWKQERKRALELKDEGEAPVTPKKNKRDKPRDGGKQRKESAEWRKRKERRKELESTEQEEEEEEEEELANAGGDLSEAPWIDGPERSPAPSRPAEKEGEGVESSGANQKKNRPELKLQSIKELMQEKEDKKKRKKPRPRPPPRPRPRPQPRPRPRPLRKRAPSRS